jgi:hypothetical protein
MDRSAKQRKRVQGSSDYRKIEGISIIDLIERAGGVRAAKLSSSCYKYYCPLHNDRKDASLTANPLTGSHQCWAGCTSGGPVQWVMAWKRMSREEAMSWLKAMR